MFKSLIKTKTKKGRTSKEEVLLKTFSNDEGVSFEYQIQRSLKAKRIIIRLNKKGECILVIPKRSRFSQSDLLQKAEDFVSARYMWIVEGLRKIRMKKEKSLSDLGLDKGIADHSKKEVALLRKKTLELVKERLEHFNKYYGFKYGEVRVKNMSSRWGSCSKSGNLNFSQTLGLLTQKELDYVVVHELCHIGEFNHSKNFWKLVERTIPDYKSIKVKMKGRVL